MAFVKPYRLDHVREAMEGAGVDSFSFAEARGIGHHKGERERAEMAQDLISAIVKAAKSDEPGSGKVMAFDLSDVVDISSGTTGPDAIRHREGVHG
jgi:nitrogen regulatory protein PII